MYLKKVNFLSELELQIGEQKVDIVFKKDSTRTIEKEAYSDFSDKMPLRVKSYKELDQYIYRFQNFKIL